MIAWWWASRPGRTLALSMASQRGDFVLIVG